MKVTFLGTGTSQGVPVPMCSCHVCKSENPKDNRLRTSIYLEHHDTCIQIDTGPDFRQQMLREKISCIDGVIFTHAHHDHISGLDDIRCFNFKYGKSMNVYADNNVEKRLHEVFSYIFAEKKYPGAPEIQINKIATKPFQVKNLEIIPIQIFHGKLQILGFRIGDFTYITDASKIPKTEWSKIEGSKVIVLNALRQESHPTHFHLEEAIKIIEHFSPEKAYFTHMSHKIGPHDKVNTILPKNMYLAYDGLKIEIKN